jgi:hypothetical protein
VTIVDEIKSRIDILDEIGASVKLKRTGKNHVGLCPFHPNSRTPALAVFPGTQTWKCFGCEKGGDVFDFVMLREGWDFKETMRYLAGKAGIELKPLTPDEQQRLDAKREREAIFGAAADYFRKQLGAPTMLPVPASAMNPGLVYALYERRWTTATLRDSWTGYFGKDWNGLRAHFQQTGINLEAPAAVALIGFQGDVAAWGQRWGVKVAAGWVEDRKIPAMPPNMLIYVHLVRGRVIYLSGRKLEVKEDQAKSWNPPSELVGDRSVYFNQVWWGEKESKFLVIVEGQADAKTLGQWNIPAVALCGSSISYEHSDKSEDGGKPPSSDNLLLSELRRKTGKTGRIVVGLDREEEQKKALAIHEKTKKLIQDLSGSGFTVVQLARVEWPLHDANAWLQDGGTAAAANLLVSRAETVLQDLIANAEPTGDSTEGGKSDEEAVQKLFAELARLGPFDVERVRDEVTDRLRLRKRMFDGLLKAARRDAGRNDDGEPAYFVEGGRIFARYFDQRGGETVEALCNFSAAIQGDVLRDNGQDIIREFHIRGTIGKFNLPLARVRAEDFSKMDWVLSSWGSRAIIEAGSRRRDQLRAAIQHLSPDVQRMVVYTHTGWRDIDSGTGNKRIYLTAAGAVGGDHVDVELDRDLELYAVPPIAKDPADAMALSLTYLDIAPDRVAFPLWAAMFLPPLRDLVNVAFALWIYGASGTMKSTYAALALNHYGPQFDDKHLPANFTDTANRLEQKSFVVKDAPLLIDDFAPQKDQRSYTEYTRTAHRIVRAAGNLAGRGRLSADSTARATYDPRSLVMITGEDLPESESLVARLFVVEVNRGDVDKAKLSALQAKRERLSHAMSGYLTWASQNWSTWTESVPKQWRTYRQEEFEAGYHLRLPEAVAGLMIGTEMGLRYALTLGVINSNKFHRLTERARVALREGAQAMSNRVKEEKPEMLFIRTISDLLVQGKIYFRGINEMYPPIGGPAEHSEMLGWYDLDRFYLLPEATYNRISKHFRDQGNVFPVREVTLRKMLAEAGMIEMETTKDGISRRTKSINVEKASRRVMVLRRSLLQEQEGEEK